MSGVFLLKLDHALSWVGMVAGLREAFDNGNGDKDCQEEKDDVESHTVIFGWLLVEFHL